MPDKRDRGFRAASVAAALLALAGTASCGKDDAKPPAERPVLRLGVSNAPLLSAERGVQGFISNISNEVLLRVNQEGRLEAALAESWKRSDDGLLLTVTLRNGVRFHDGTLADAASVAQILSASLPRTLKAAYQDVESISAVGERDVVVHFRQPSSFVADSFIDVPIQKAGTSSVGTGPFMPPPAGADAPKRGTAEVVANDGYYLGAPKIGRIAITTYPNTRAAWADMLRNQLDMLYEVGADAIETMRGASNVVLHTFDRPYQYVVFFNTQNPKLRDPRVRQALNEAIDRNGLVRDALGGHGSPSSGPVSPHHWAFDNRAAAFGFAPESAARKLGKPLALRCVTIAEAPFEQLSLVVKQQLKAVGVDVSIEEVPLEQVLSTLGTPDFELVLLEYSAGWSLTRAYRWWHSQGPANAMKFSSPVVDSSLDRVRHATRDDDYRAAVAAFQQAIAQDPPAIFLAWSDRSRAISTRFEVAEDRGRPDVIGSLRLLRPTADNHNATRN